MATAVWYGLAMQKSFTSTATDDIEWTTDTIKIALVTATYSPNQDTDNYANLAGFSGNKVGTDQTLAGKTLTYDATSNTVRFKCTDPTWTSLSATWRYAVIYKDTGSTATSPLIGLVDFTANQTITGGNFTLNFDTTDGALRVVVS